MPINKRSIAGYVAETGSALVIDDAYAIGDDVPYAFNPAFDRETGYRTVSMLTLPLKAKGGSTVGVMQLVNALDPDTHQPVAFAERDRLYVALFAQNAAVEIERASLTRLIILRMIRMAELRDPGETGAHVSRVAAYSIEIYQRWAETHGVKPTEMRKNKDVLRLGAMLHDVGKIAIPDAILKKPGALSADERNTMKQHTVFGARLFKEWESRLDAVASEIALTHHERWDGSGYPGVIENLEQEPIRPGRGKREDEIPLFGRIVALADVYDALISHRTYKEPWSEDRVLETIREEAGYQFDPEVVDAFLDVYETIQAIRARYTE
jgi:putative nucleotidyltransferase with HDIG domain